MDFYLINLAVYQTFLMPVIFFSALFYIVSFVSIFPMKSSQRFARLSDAQLPTISVQIPVFNDPVAARCIERCLKFDYPKNKYRIVVADDSTDPVTKKIIDRYVEKYPGRVKVFRRAERKGWKAGALNNVLRHTEEEYIVIFDSDFVPKRDFLRKIVEPFFNNPKVAIVQTNTKWLNNNTNIVTRYASAVMYVYYGCIMPIANSLGVALLGGTGGAIKTSVLKKHGGWNEKSLTEDSDLSVKLFVKGYKSVYLYDLEVKGEVPVTLGALIRQQTRWAYGSATVIAQNWKSIFFSPKLSAAQKAMIYSYIVISYMFSPFILGMAISGNLGWILTPTKPIELADILNITKNFALTSGFFLIVAIALHRVGKLRDIPKTFISMLTVGIVLNFTSFVAFIRGLLGLDLSWVRTPKAGSIPIYEFFKNAFRM
jgi:cellulose synthase/poly-beta-1,6-N-acetylglucosamine synthase-like glycosyltransferase